MALDDIQSFINHAGDEYIDEYYEYYASNIFTAFFSQLSIRQKPAKEAKPIRQTVRKKLIALYPIVKFSSLKTR